MSIDPHQIRKAKAELDRVADAELVPADDTEVLEGEVVEGDDYEDDGPRGLAVIEHGAYVVAGVSTVARRVWASRTTSTYDRMIQAAQAVGQHETALEWEARRAAYQNDRHARRFDWIELPAKVIGFLPKAGMGCGGLLMVVGILLAIATKDAAMVVAPIVFIADTVEFVIVVVSVTWLYVLIAAPIVAVLAFWAVGRRAAEDGDVEWLATSADVNMDIEIDERTISLALGALRIPQITAYLKQGLPLQFITTARADGRGTHAVIRLPVGVPAELIAKPNRRAQLASGLYRATKEVWPTTGTEAGILDLWVADKGALAEGAGPYPLLSAGLTDWFKGVPYGKTLRGTALVAPFEGRNTIVGGMPDQGKSSGARVLAAGAQLDITVELRIWVPDSNFDFEVFRPRCSRYVMGAEDEKIAQILADLRELFDEIQIRGDLLVKHQEPEVTRQLASAGVGLHPILGLVEEAHVAMNHAAFGEEIRYLVGQIVMLGRKRAIHLILSTQAPTKDSMPKEVTRNCSNGIAFAVGDHYANDAILGQGAHRGGHRATDLIPGTDAGTALVKGFTGQRSEMVQAYFLSVRRGNDQVTPLIERSLAEMARLNKAVPGTDRARNVIESRDLLDDLGEALEDAEARMRLTDVVGILRKNAPGWNPYQRMTGADLGTHLAQLKIRVYKTGNIPSVDPADVHAAVAKASTADLDEE